MIALFSRWQLDNGCPPILEQALQELAAVVKKEEPGTLIFSVNFPSPPPPIGPPPEYGVVPEEAKVIPIAEQEEIMLFEVYRDAEAFSTHLRGSFAKFLLDYRYLLKTPWQGHPVPKITYLAPHSIFVRQALADKE